LIPSDKRARFADLQRKRRHRTVTSIEFAGRWSLLRTQRGSRLPLTDGPIEKGNSAAVSEKPSSASATPALLSRSARDEAIEAFARVLLRRYGVVFRRLMERESLKVSWFELGRIFRRLEA